MTARPAQSAFDDPANPIIDLRQFRQARVHIKRSRAGVTAWVYRSNDDSSYKVLQHTWADGPPDDRIPAERGTALVIKAPKQWFHLESGAIDTRIALDLTGARGIAFLGGTISYIEVKGSGEESLSIEPTPNREIYATDLHFIAVGAELHNGSLQANRIDLDGFEVHGEVAIRAKTVFLLRRVPSFAHTSYEDVTATLRPGGGDPYSPVIVGACSKGNLDTSRPIGAEIFTTSPTLGAGGMGI